MNSFVPNGWGLLCHFGRVFLTYTLIYQQIFLGVVWANGDLIRVEITQDNALQTHGSFKRLKDENLPLKLKVTRQKSDSAQQKATQEKESILYERRLHFKNGINENKKLPSTTSLRLTSTHTDGALNLLFKEKGLNLRFLIRPTGEVSIEKLIAQDAIELCTVGRITTGLSSIKATSLSLVGKDILNYTSLCTSKELALTAVGTQARKGLITNMAEGKIKSQGSLDVFKGDFHNQGTFEAVKMLKADFHRNNLFNCSQEKGYSLILGKKSLSLRNIDRCENASEMKSDGSLLIESNTLENLKTISSGRKLKIRTLENLSNLQGTIQSEHELTLNVAGSLYNQAALRSHKKIDLSVSEHFENTTLGQVSAPSLSLVCLGLGQNKGQLTSQSLKINAATFENYHQIETQEGELNELPHGEGFHLYENSLLSANKHLNIIAKSLIVDQGALIKTGSLDGILFYLANSGHIISQEVQDLKVGRFYNESKLRANILILTVFDTFQNVSDSVEGTKTLTLGVKTLLNYGQLKSKIIQGRIAHLNNEGTIQADERLQASIQQLENQGLILSVGDIWVNELSNSSANSGLIQAQEVYLNSQQEHLSHYQEGSTLLLPQAHFLNRGSIIAKSKISLLLGILENNGMIEASEQAGRLFELKNDGSLRAKTLLSFYVTSQLINNGIIDDTQEISIISEGKCTNTNTISASKALILNCKDSFSNLGMICSPLITFQGRILKNKGQIIGKQVLDVKTQGFINEKEGRLKGEEVNINSQKASKNIGLIKAKKTLRVKGLNFINRLSGQLYSQGTFLGRLKGKLINKGKIKAVEQIDLDSSEVENDGTLKSEGTVKLTADKLESSGPLKGDEAVTLTVKQKGDLKGGPIVTKGRLTVSGGTVKVCEGVSLESLAIYLLLQHFENYGTMYAQKEIYSKAENIINHGTIKSGESITFEGTLSLINNGIIDTNSLKLLGVRKLDNTHKIVAHHALEGQIDNLQNKGLLQGRTLHLTNLNTLFLNETDGKVLGTDTFEVSGQGKLENKGTIETHRGSLTLKPQLLSNHGNINATTHSLIIEAPKVDNAGQLLGEDISLSSQNFQNSKEGKVLSRQGKAEFVCRQTLRNAGILQAPGTISLTALNTINEGQVLSLVRILIATNTLTNKGLLQASKIEWAKRLNSFLNEGNVISISPFALEADSFTNQGTIKGENLAFTILEGQNSGLLLSPFITLIFQDKFCNAAEGKIITDKGFEVSGEGEFENHGHIGEATLKNSEATEVHPGGQLTFRTKSLSNHGSINAGGNNLALETEVMTNAGNLKGNLAFKKSIATFVNEAAGQISSLTPFILESISFINRGLLSAPSLILIFTNGENEGTLYGQAFLKLVFRELFSQSSEGKTISKDILEIAGEGKLVNQGEMLAEGKTTVQGIKLENHGKISSDDTLIFESLQDPLMNAKTGIISSLKSVLISNTSFIENSGIITSHILKASNFNAFIQHGLLKGSDTIQLVGEHLDNNDRLTSHGEIDLRLSQGFDNNGTISLIKTEESDSSPQAIVIDSPKLINKKDILSCAGLSLTITLLENLGVIQGAIAKVKAAKHIANEGDLKAKEALEIEALSLKNQKDIKSAGTLRLNTASLTNIGLIHGKQAHVSVSQNFSNNSLIEASEQLEIVAPQTNAWGEIVSAGELRMSLQQDITDFGNQIPFKFKHLVLNLGNYSFSNSRDQVIPGSFSIKAASVTNTASLTLASADFDLTGGFTNSLVSTTSLAHLICKEGLLTIKASFLNNTFGTLFANGPITATINTWIRNGRRWCDNLINPPQGRFRRYNAPPDYLAPFRSHPELDTDMAPFPNAFWKGNKSYMASNETIFLKAGGPITNDCANIHTVGDMFIETPGYFINFAGRVWAEKDINIKSHWLSNQRALFRTIECHDEAQHHDHGRWYITGLKGHYHAGKVKWQQECHAGSQGALIHAGSKLNFNLATGGECIASGIFSGKGMAPYWAGNINYSPQSLYARACCHEGKNWSWRQVTRETLGCNNASAAYISFSGLGSITTHGTHIAPYISFNVASLHNGIFDPSHETATSALLRTSFSFKEMLPFLEIMGGLITHHPSNSNAVYGISCPLNFPYQLPGITRLVEALPDGTPIVHLPRLFDPIVQSYALYFLKTMLQRKGYIYEGIGTSELLVVLMKNARYLAKHKALPSVTQRLLEGQKEEDQQPISITKATVDCSPEPLIVQEVQDIEGHQVDVPYFVGKTSDLNFHLAGQEGVISGERALQGKATGAVENPGTLHGGHLLDIKAGHYHGYQRTVIKDVTTTRRTGVLRKKKTDHHTIKVAQPGGNALSGGSLKIKALQAQGIRQEGGAIIGDEKKGKLTAKQGPIDIRPAQASTVVTWNPGSMGRLMGRKNAAVVPVFIPAHVKFGGASQTRAENDWVRIIGSDFITRGDQSFYGRKGILVSDIHVPYVAEQRSSFRGLGVSSRMTQKVSGQAAHVVSTEGSSTFDAPEGPFINRGSLIAASKTPNFLGQHGNFFETSHTSLKSSQGFTGARGLGFTSSQTTVHDEFLSHPIVISDQNFNATTPASNVATGLRLDVSDTMRWIAGVDNIFNAAHRRRTVETKGFSLSVDFFGASALDKAFHGGSGEKVLGSLAKEDAFIQSVSSLIKSHDTADYVGNGMHTAVDGYRLLYQIGQTLNSGGSLLNMMGQRLGITDKDGNFDPRITIRAGTYSSKQTEDLLTPTQMSAAIGVFESGRDTSLLEGTQGIFTEEAQFDVGRDLTLEAGFNTSSSHAQNAGVSVSFNARSLSGFDAGVDYAEQRSQSATPINAAVTAPLITAHIGRNMSLKGAQMRALEILADIQGKLSIETVQATSSFESLSFAASTSGMIQFATAEASRAWATTMSGLFTEGHNHVIAEGGTTLTGAAIVSNTNQVTLETPTLVQQDLHSHDTGKSLSVGLTGLDSLSGYKPIPQAGIHGMLDVSVRRHNVQAVTPSIVGDASQAAVAPKVTKSSKTHWRIAVPLANPEEVQKGFDEIGRAVSGNQDLKKLQYRLPTSLAVQPGELDEVYHAMRADGATHDQALQLLSNPVFAKLILKGQRFKDQIIAIKLPPESGEEDFKASVREQDTPASQRAFTHLLGQYAEVIVETAKEHPFLAQAAIVGLQAAISGPVSAFISVAKDFTLGDKIEEIETKAIQYVSSYLEVPEDKVEITENCIKLAFAFFLGGSKKHIVDAAEGIVKAVKKRVPKTALNPHKLSTQGKHAVEKASASTSKISNSQKKPIAGISTRSTGKRFKNRIPDRGEPNAIETNASKTTFKKYGDDGWVQKEFNKGHGNDSKIPIKERIDHIHDYKPNQFHPNGRPERQPGRPLRKKDKVEFGLIKKQE